ncbi:MAG: hypothetical protein IJV72_01955 [Clostridia bacterium]|nr:hypothetical protein [Clostridia bacterium]
MEYPNRMEYIFEESRKKGKNRPQNTFEHDLHKFATERYFHLERWEKLARSMADAVKNQKIFIEPYDRIIGRTFYYNDLPVEKKDPDILYKYRDKEDIRIDVDGLFEGYSEYLENQLVAGYVPGHIAWDWNTILCQGTEGIRRRCYRGLERSGEDRKSYEFYNGVLIMLEALETWNDMHVAELERMGMTEEAEICRRVPRYPARTFREAVQSFFMQFIVVMKENPHGGNSPGRLDYYLWPFLENDIKNGVCTLDEARELIEELFFRMDERIFVRDTFGETVVVGGCYPNGASSVNPLSYIMIETVIKYDITHPMVYARIPKNPPPEFVELCARYVKRGKNRAQLMNDESVIKALILNGVSNSDAVDYYCGGCMEIGVQGKTSDFLFVGYQNVAKMLELCVTGGYCLQRKKRLKHFNVKSLEECESFEDFYEGFLLQAEKIFTLSLRYQDILSEYCESARPAYLVSSMVEDCLTKGRNMHGGGAIYHDYGASYMGIPNASDSLYAIKKAVFDDRICTARTLLAALEADFEGYEELRRGLLAIPKYGQQDEGADKMMSRLVTDIGRIVSSYVNRFGGGGKMTILTFIYAPEAGAILGASPDGRRAGVPIAHGVTPQSMSMTKGITAAINSCTSIPFEVFNGGASTMWDLDSEWASENIIKAIFATFFEQGGQIFQGNVTAVKELLAAQKDPESHKHVIVRVGGFSARFVNLSPAVQNEIINRVRHNS